MKKWIIAAAAALLIAAGLFVVQTRQVAAHEGREVGDYEVELGWQMEPAYAGVFNGPEVSITDAAGEPVVGAEQTLKLQANFGGKSKQLELEPAWSDPGHYLAYLTPTRPGDYEFVLTGVITVSTALTPTLVNETFTSADGEFGTVEPSRDILFPDTTADPISLQREIDALKAEIDALKAEVAALKAP